MDGILQNFMKNFTGDSDDKFTFTHLFDYYDYCATTFL